MCFNTFFVPSQDPYFNPSLLKQRNGLGNVILESILYCRHPHKLQSEAALTRSCTARAARAICFQGRLPTNVYNRRAEEPTCSSLSISSYSFSRSASRSQVTMATDWARVFLHCSHDASGTDRTAMHKVLRLAWANS